MKATARPIPDRATLLTGQFVWLISAIGGGVVFAGLLAGSLSVRFRGVYWSDPWYWFCLVVSGVAAAAGLLCLIRRQRFTITTARIICQVVFFTLFLVCVGANTFAQLDRLPGLARVLSKFLEIDPLIAVASALTTHTIYKGLIWSLTVIIPTLLLGRIFCGWICPYGSLHHFIGWAFNRRKIKQRMDANRYRPMYAFKYYVLVAMLVAAAFGSLQIGLLDPICLLFRSFTVSLVPTWDMGVLKLEQLAEGTIDLSTGARIPLDVFRLRVEQAMYQLGWIIGFLLVFFLAMNVVIPRFFCRVVCPLGALMGILSRFSLWRIDRSRETCNDCGLCLSSCEGASDPHTKLRKSECFVCFNCMEDCPVDAIRFTFVPAKAGEVTDPDFPRRRVLFAGLTGLLFFAFGRASGRTTRNFSSRVIRPPGAVEEIEFLRRCVKCGQCLRVCPTGVLQPAWFEAGLEGLWTPVMNFRVGACQYRCVACGHVCPTGAIRPISLEEKHGLGPFRDRGPIRIGTAHVDPGRCLPWSKNIPCVVCEEVCPTSPKAVYAEYRQMAIRDGKKRVVYATEVTVTLEEYPAAGQTAGRRCAFRPDQFRGDNTVRYCLDVLYRDGRRRNYPVASGSAGPVNDVDTIRIAGRFDPLPQPGDVVVIKMEYKLPKVDIDLCIGCGLCERHCPVVGDRRGIYVTAEGETRSRYQQDPDRNRSLQLISRRER